MSTEAGTIVVDDVIDAQRFNLFNANVILWCFLLMVCDGYDLTVIGFAMPGIAKELDIRNMALVGPVFSASAFGVLVGAPLLGYCADRLGRKPVIVLSTLFFAAAVMATSFAGSITALIVIRFFSGLGLGGIIPLGIVMTSEFAPRRLRARAITIASTGLTLGAGLPGMTAPLLLAHHDWRVLFWLGGLIPLVIALVVIFALPESVKYLAVRAQRRSELSGLLLRMQPALALDPATRFVLREEKRETPSLRYLFAGRFAVMTPLLWIMFIVLGTVIFFIQQWTPTIFLKQGLPLSAAGFSVAMFQTGGVLGGLSMGWPVDRFGVWPLVLCYVIAIPLIMAIGLPGIPQLYLPVLLFVAGFVMLAIQLGVNALSGLMYPTFIRGNGVGWGLGILRLGQILGSVSAGFLIGSGLSPNRLFFLLGLPLTIGALASLAMKRVFVLAEER